MKRVLFVCSRNWSRSPTSESVFGDHPDIEVASAGTSPDVRASRHRFAVRLSVTGIGLCIGIGIEMEFVSDANPA